jgi:ketosteroid isomerase-like protein
VTTADDRETISAFNEAIAAADIPSVSERLHPDVVWEHNLGGGSPEEGVYRGRESVLALFERIVEPWESLRPVPLEIRDLGEGRYDIKGELRAKHSTSSTPVVSPYFQRVEIRDGLLVKAQMTTGSDRLRESANVELVRASFAAYEAEDLDAIQEMMHPDFELHEWPEGPGASVYKGMDGVRQALQNWAEAWEYITAEPRGFVESGDHVFVFIRNLGKGRGSSIEMEVDTFAVYTVRDGQVSKIQYFTDRGAALAAAGLTEEQIRQEET